MGRFDAPYPGNEGTKNTQWAEAAHRGMDSPDHLWGEYWQRFNTFRIPLLDKEEYFRTAMAFAKDSKSREDFEQRFEEENKRRLKMLRSMLKNMYWDLEENLPTRTARNATSDAQDLSCLEHLVRLLNGYISDRKADIESAKTAVEKQNHTEENPLQERGLVFIEDETATLIREIGQSPSIDPAYEEYRRTGRIPNEWASQPPRDIDWGYEFNKQHQAARERHRESDFFTRTNIESLTFASDDAALHALGSDDDTPSIQQVPSLTSNDSQDLEKGNESLATQDELRKRSSVSSKSKSSNSAKKRVRFDADEDISTREPKRRRLENTLAHAETSPISPTTRTSSIQAANGSVSRKRSRADKDEDDNGFKRQKIESLPRPPSSVSTDVLAGGGPEKVLDEQDPENNDSGRKRRKQKSKSPTLRATSSRNILNTRSSRRAKPSTLWELDSSGKPRST